MADAKRSAPVIIGPFEVLTTIGRGGTSTVYKVRHQPTGVLAALKIVPRGLHLEAGAVERLHQEFTSIRPLRHPNVIRAFAHGDYQGAPFVVLEFVDGQNLEEHIKQKGSFSSG